MVADEQVLSGGNEQNSAYLCVIIVPIFSKRANIVFTTPAMHIGIVVYQWPRGIDFRTSRDAKNLP